MASKKEQIIKYLLQRDRFGENCIHFTPKCYDNFPKIDNQEIKSIILLLRDEGYIDCKFLTRKENSMCWIRLKAPILNYMDNKKKARLSAVKKIFKTIANGLKWLIFPMSMS